MLGVELLISEETMFRKRRICSFQTLMEGRDKEDSNKIECNAEAIQMPCIQRMHKARGKLSAREVLDVIRRQQEMCGTLRKVLSNTAQKRVARESYREEERRSTGFEAGCTSLRTLPTPQGALCWIYSPDAGSGYAAVVLDFGVSVIAHLSSASAQH
jgi:hypothetical protein